MQPGLGGVSLLFQRRTVKIKIKLTLDHLILGVGIVFLALQIPEEGLLNFAAWADRAGVVPGFSITAWLLLQPYILLALSLAFFIYRTDPGKFLPIGLGILVWGVLDFAWFAGVGLILRSYVPGLLSSILFLLPAWLSVRILRRAGNVTKRLAVLSFLSGLLIMAIPMAAFFGVYWALTA